MSHFPWVWSGAGEKNGYSALKKHKFFEGIKWETLFEQNPPHFSNNSSAVGSIDLTKKTTKTMDSEEELLFLGGESQLTKPFDRQASEFFRTDERTQNPTQYSSSTSLKKTSTCPDVTKSISILSGILQFESFFIFSKEGSGVLYSNSQLVLFSKTKPRVILFSFRI